MSLSAQIDQEKARSLVVHNRPTNRVVNCGVAHVALADGQILMKEKADLPRVGSLVVHHHPAQIETFVKIHAIRTGQQQTHTRVLALHIGDQGVGLVAHHQVPTLCAFDPGEGAVYESPEATESAVHVILAPHARIGQLAQPVVAVESNQNFTVPDW
jgi:hypothetical protein